jgi:hypothetical protein
MKTLIAAVLATGLLPAAETRFGKPLTLKEPVTIDTLLASPAAYAGKTVQVKGKITAVCQMMGCWMELVSDSGKSVRIKVNDGEIEFPKDSAGLTAVAEGKLTRIDLTHEQAIARARHEAEEMGRKFDPASVKGAISFYQIEGAGAVIFKGAETNK